MNRQLYMGGGIMNAMPREQFGIGSSLKKLGKKAVGAVKDIASSDVGKAALLYGATAGLGSIGSGLTGMARFAPSNFMGNVGRIGNFITGGSLMNDPTGLYAEGLTTGSRNNNNMSGGDGGNDTAPTQVATNVGGTIVTAPSSAEVSQSKATDVTYDSRKTKAKGRSMTIMTGPRGIEDETLTLGRKSLLGQ